MRGSKEQTDIREVIFGKNLLDFLLFLGIFLPFDVPFPALSLFFEVRDLTLWSKRESIGLGGRHGQSWDSKKLYGKRYQREICELGWVLKWKRWGGRLMELRKWMGGIFHLEWYQNSPNNETGRQQGRLRI